MLSGACCDTALQAAVAGIQGGDYAGSPILQARLIADYQNRTNWTYDPSTNACTWTAPPGTTYNFDAGGSANVMSPFNVDAAHYGGGCVAGGLPNGPVQPAPAQAAAASSSTDYILLAAVAFTIGWFLHGEV